MSLRIDTPRAVRPLAAVTASDRGARAALAEQVHRRLRADILQARLRPGEALSENGLAQHLGVSRTPVREAVQRLAREGMVHVLPQRGSYVARLSMQRILEALFVREAVETHVVRRLLDAPANPAGLKTLDACIDQQADALAAGDIDAVMAADERFHHLLLDLCGMGGAWPVVAQARDMHRRVRAIAVPELHSGHQAITDHRAIVRALRRRDAARAQQSVMSHLKRNITLTQRIAALHPDYFDTDDHAHPQL